MVNRKKTLPLVIGNWKMHGSSTSNAQLISQLLEVPSSTTNMAICVPYPYLQQCKELLSHSEIAWGAQDVSAHLQGAFTGEVSADMLLDFGCQYILLGHSERRTYHHETDQLVAEKALTVLKAGMVPVVCLGETLAQRQSDRTEQVVRKQIKTVLDALPTDALSKLVLAYEPVWAIGTGKTATAYEAQAVHAFLRREVAMYDEMAAKEIPIIYGGSVKPENAKELFSMLDIDGGLIGGASLKAKDFLQIAHAY
jgi:triosephosphate isomerase